MANLVDDLRRLRAANDYDRLDWHLDNWARYMRMTGFNKLDPPNRSPIIGISHGADFDQIYEEVTQQTAEAVNACVESLGRAEQGALRAEYLDEEWNYSTPHHVVLALARETLQALMNKRGIS